MKKMKLTWIALVLLLSLSALLLVACGSREDAGKGRNAGIASGGSSVGSSGGGTTTCTVGSVALTATPSSISVNGTSSIAATVLDNVGANCQDGTTVTFAVTSGTGAVSGTGSTVSGVATTSFTAASTPGSSTITGTSGGISNTAVVTVTAPAAGSIQFTSATPSLIGLDGTGGTTQSTIVFTVKDINGNNVVDGTAIDLCLLGPSGGRLPSAGGEYINDNDIVTEAFTDANSNGCYEFGEAFVDDPLGVTGQYDSPIHAAVSTVSGTATAALSSGSVAGPVIILASVSGTSPLLASASTPIAIGGGTPNNAHLTVSRLPVNLEGLEYVDIQSTVSVYMADRFGNFNVLAGTAVSFYAEAGAIAASNTVDATGATSVTYRTQWPDPVDVAVVDNGGAGCDGDNTSLNGAISSTEWELCLQEYVNNTYGTSVTTNPRDGWATVMVSTRGEEAFDDLNGNGIFDGAGEFTAGTQDTSLEAFIDVDDDSTRDTSPFEIFFDDDGSGTYDGANGTWDSDKTIFKDIRMLITGSPAYIKFNQATGFAIADGGSLTFKILVADVNLNYLISGTTIAITKTGAGTLVGTASYTFPDAFKWGPKEMFITLQDADSGDTDAAEPVVMTVKVTWRGIESEAVVSGTVD